MIKKIIIILFLVLIGIIGTAFFYLNNVYIPKRLKPVVIEMLEKGTRKRVSIDKAFYFPFKGVLFSKISITNADRSPFLSIDKVDLSLKSFPRIKGKELAARARLIVDGLTFQQQQLALEGNSVIDVDMQGRDKENVLFTAALALDNLQIKGITGVSDITAINGKIMCTHDTFSSDQLRASVGGQAVNVQLEGKYGRDQLILRTLQLDYGKTTLTLQGKIVNFEAPQVEAEAKGVVNLEDVAKVLSGMTIPPLSGECIVTAQGNGPLSNLAAVTGDLRADIAKGAVDKIAFSHFKVVVELANGIAHCSPLNCILYEGRINAAAKATISKNDIPVQFSADAEKINIEFLVQDIMGNDMGGGTFDAHIGASGSAADLNTLSGSGWFKIVEGTIQAPPNFEKVARTLGAGRLVSMEIKESSATFAISGGKAQTEDFIAVADEAIVSGKGYIDLEQYVDFEAIFKLSPEFVQSSGGVGQFLNFVSDESGAPVAKVKVYGRIPKLQYKTIPLPVGDILKDKVKDGLEKTIKDIFSQEKQEDSEKSDIQDQLKEGLKKLFKR